ncbi:MAG: GNAT family N-acetyltransferase [Candidatus Adiutricales bacterium]|jgi:hypothetical protein
MAMLVEIEADNRYKLEPLFENCQYDRVLIDSVLEGCFGRAYADSASKPTVSRLDSGGFTMLGGDPDTVGVKELLQVAPVQYVTPQNDKWQNLLEDEFGVRISKLPFTDFSAFSLDPNRLAEIIRNIPSPFRLKQIDKPLAEKLPSDVGNEYFFENFWSIDDFLGRGIGYCILHQNKIISAATSMAQSSKAIDIEIETVPDFRKRNLGSVVGAKLLSHCLGKGIEPHWVAANAISEKLALKLGYIRRESYETFAIQ